jgi:hypothetical protein
MRSSGLFGRARRELGDPPELIEARPERYLELLQGRIGIGFRFIGSGEIDPLDEAVRTRTFAPVLLDSVLPAADALMSRATPRSSRLAFRLSIYRATPALATAATASASVPIATTGSQDPPGSA